MLSLVSVNISDMLTETVEAVTAPSSTQLVGGRTQSISLHHATHAMKTENKQ